MYACILYVPMFVCLCMYSYASMLMYVCFCMYAYVCIHLYVCLHNVCFCMYAYVCLLVFLCMYEYASDAYVCMLMCNVHVDVCVCRHVHMFI